MSGGSGQMRRRRCPRWAYLAASIGGGAALIFLARLIVGPSHPGQPMSGAQILTFTGLASLALVWALAVGIAAFRGMDEFQQSADKFAWYWGGTAGLALSCAAYAFIAMGGLQWLGVSSLRLDPKVSNAFELGYFTALIPIVGGFLAVRAWWQVTRR